VRIEEAQAGLAPNVMARGLVLEYTAAKTREWQEAEQRWQQWAAAAPEAAQNQGQGQGQGQGQEQEQEQEN
jgi:hypothetical protein